jgi:hypothetical protein
VVFLLYLELPVDAGVATEVLCQYLIGHSLSASEEARSTPLSRFPIFITLHPACLGLPAVRNIHATYPGVSAVSAS